MKSKVGVNYKIQCRVFCAPLYIVVVLVSCGIYQNSPKYSGISCSVYYILYYSILCLVHTITTIYCIGISCISLQLYILYVVLLYIVQSVCSPALSRTTISCVYICILVLYIAILYFVPVYLLRHYISYYCILYLIVMLYTISSVYYILYPSFASPLYLVSQYFGTLYTFTHITTLHTQTHEIWFSRCFSIAEVLVYCSVCKSCVLKVGTTYCM